MSITADLESISERAELDLAALHGQRLFITGGTGFVGTWLLSALHHAELRLNLRLRTTVLTREPESFAIRQPALAAWSELVRGDVTAVPDIGRVDAVIHAATPASAAFNDAHPDLMRSTIVNGMESVLAATMASGPIPFLFTSSGAIYGPQPLDMQRIPETYVPAPNSIQSRNAYALGKLDAEAIAANAIAAGRPSVKVARLFAFVGPYLPLDAHFAVGNFIRDALAGGPIAVHGDGLAVRSYMYSADLVVALLAILVRGEVSTPYNVGSEDAITIAELAKTVRDEVAADAAITIAGQPIDTLPTGAGSRYVPDCTRLREDLVVTPQIDLREGIRRTARWARG